MIRACSKTEVVTFGRPPTGQESGIWWETHQRSSPIPENVCFRETTDLLASAGGWKENGELVGSACVRALWERAAHKRQPCGPCWRTAHVRYFNAEWQGALSGTGDSRNATRENERSGTVLSGRVGRFDVICVCWNTIEVLVGRGASLSNSREIPIPGCSVPEVGEGGHFWRIPIPQCESKHLIFGRIIDFCVLRTLRGVMLEYESSK
jgi:hypothetical protein